MKLSLLWLLEETPVVRDFKGFAGEGRSAQASKPTSPQFWIYVLALPVIHMILGKSFDLSDLQFPHLEHGNNNTSCNMC